MAAPCHQVRGELGRDGIEELRSGCQSHVGEIKQQAPGEPQSVVDVEAAVEIGVVDEAFPSHRGARFLEVDAHDDEQVFGQAVGFLFQTAGVLDGGVGVVYGAGAGDDQETLVAALMMSPIARRAAVTVAVACSVIGSSSSTKIIGGTRGRRFSILRSSVVWFMAFQRWYLTQFFRRGELAGDTCPVVRSIPPETITQHARVRRIRYNGGVPRLEAPTCTRQIP